MDQSLQAHVKIEVISDVVRIDVRGNLTRASRPSLMQIIQRVRRMGITSHIRVDLSRAAFIEFLSSTTDRTSTRLARGSTSHARRSSSFTPDRSTGCSWSASCLAGHT